MAKSPEQLAHEQWLGYIQPEGLVVSTPALLEARAAATSTLYRRTGNKWRFDRDIRSVRVRQG